MTLNACNVQRGYWIGKFFEVKLTPLETLFLSDINHILENIYMRMNLFNVM